MRTNRHPMIVRILVGLALIIATVLVLFSQDLVPGNRLLYDAIEQGDVAAARQLLDAGADPNSRWRGFDQQRTERYRFRPLAYAMQYREPEIAQLLVQAGADPNTRTPQGEPALILAVNNGDVELVRTLLNYGADPAISMASGETALHYGGPLQGMPKEAIDPEIRALLAASETR